MSQASTSTGGLKLSFLNLLAAAAAATVAAHSHKKLTQAPKNISAKLVLRKGGPNKKTRQNRLFISTDLVPSQIKLAMW